MPSRPALLLAATALLAGCSRSPAPAAADSAAATTPVQVARVVAADLPVLTEVTGTVRTVRRALLAAQVMGTIVELPVTLGQSVAAGELLARLSVPEVAARIAQAQAQLNVARRDLARERLLLGKGASTPDLVAGLEDRVALTEAMLREAEAMLSHAEVRAPFAGVVARRMAQAGDLATPGQPLLQLDGTDGFEVEVAAPESLLGPLAVGARLSVTIPTTGLSFTAAVAEVSSTADDAARAVTLKLAVPADATVRAGQFARVALPGPAARTLLAPAAAVTRVGAMERVFLVGEGGRAVLRLVRTGARRGDDVEVVAGLGEGDTVVVAPPPSLREGDRLEVRP
jgi:membrane fusion protein, multidrug efflux system